MRTAIVYRLVRLFFYEMKLKRYCRIVYKRWSNQAVFCELLGAVKKQSEEYSYCSAARIYGKHVLQCVLRSAFGKVSLEFDMPLSCGLCNSRQARNQARNQMSLARLWCVSSRRNWNTSFETRQ